MIRDNRQFIEKLERTNDVVRVKREVDWDLEAGAIVRRTNEKGSPAPYFEKVRDYPSGYTIFGSPLGTYRRLAIALGMQADATVEALQDEYESRTDHPIKPVIVKDAPCKDNVMTGDDVDLFQFPSPLIHDGDGGRYVGTWHAVITEDPDSGWVNWGMYRLMVQNRRHTGIDWHPGNHGGGMYFGKYVPKGKPMPVAVAIGMDPLCSLIACSYLSSGQNEVEFAGGLHRAPVEMVKAETIGLMVPAYAEIVLEGEILPQLRVQEGPHGEFPGYRNPTRDLPVFRVNAVTYRNNPILPMTCIGMPVEDCDICTPIGLAVSIRRQLRSNGIPVKDVFLPPEACSHLLIISLKSSVRDRVSRMEELLHTHWTNAEVKTIVVDEGVNVFDLKEVIHAFSTKCHPHNGIRTKEMDYSKPLTPYLTMAERKSHKGTRVIFDCTWPEDWSRERDIPPRVSFEEVYPEEIKNKVLDNWKAYGFK